MKQISPRPFLRCALALLALLFWAAGLSRAQLSAPTLEIKRVDNSQAPDYTLTAAVILPDGSAATGLSAQNFALTDLADGSPIPITGLEASNAGVAAMIVADLAGLNNTRDYGVVNTENVRRAAQQFVQTLAANSSGQDYLGLVITVGTDQNKFGEIVAPTNDLNLVASRLQAIPQLAIERTSALFDGLNQALNLLTRNPDAAVRSALEQRRKVIVLFSDGADNKFSDEGIRGDILRRANEAGIAIFAIQVNQRGPREFTNMSALAAQTNGSYVLLDSSVPQDEAERQLRAAYQRIDSQRAQYVLRFNSIKPAGEHSARLTVNLPAGSDSAEVRFASNLRPPTVRLIAPAEGELFFQETAEPAAPITLTAQVEFPDGRPRSVSVEFLANGTSIGRLDGPPYELVWQPPKEDRGIVTKTLPYAFQAIATDSYLQTTTNSPSVRTTLQVASVPAVPFVPTEAPSFDQWLRQNTALAASLCALALITFGLIVALIIMNRRYSDQLAVIRANMARSVQSGIRMVTQRLGLNRQPIAELRVVSGPMTGSTLPIGSDVVWVGRDPSQCEVVLMSDPYISSRHFQITRDPATQQFYILDEGTANGTRVNRVPLQIKTRTPLPEDAEIEVGMTKLVFQQGRRTQRLNM
jgi:hypothetical protein